MKITFGDFVGFFGGSITISSISPAHILQAQSNTLLHAAFPVVIAFLGQLVIKLIEIRLTKNKNYGKGFSDSSKGKR